MRHARLTEPRPPFPRAAQPGRPPMLTAQGTQGVQSADRVFYLNHQQLDPVQRDPENYRVQVRGRLKAQILPSQRQCRRAGLTFARKAALSTLPVRCVAPLRPCRRGACWWAMRWRCGTTGPSTWTCVSTACRTGTGLWDTVCRGRASCTRLKAARCRRRGEAHARVQACLACAPPAGQPSWPAQPPDQALVPGRLLQALPPCPQRQDGDQPAR